MASSEVVDSGQLNCHRFQIRRYQCKETGDALTDGISLIKIIFATVKVIRIDVFVPYKQRYASYGRPSKKTKIGRFVDRNSPDFQLL